MVPYADTSFLFSLYVQDANTASAGRFASGLSVGLAFTPLQRHELRNAFRLAVFRREISLEECAKLLSTVESDSRNGVLVESAVSWAEVYEITESLSAAHSSELGTRGFDVMHVAAAMALRAERFLSFDKRQKSLARKAGLRVNR